MEEALKTIISKSSLAMGDAITCLRAIAAKSPVVQQRYNHVVDLALNDPSAHFTTEERAIIAEGLSVPGSETRDFTLRVRLTQSERVTLQEAANDADLDLSEYVRRKLF